jgi:hypothetical protein
MARLPTVGGDSGDWGTVLNEYLQVEHNNDGTHKTDYLPLAGGTLSGDVDADDHVVSQMEVKDYSETVVTTNSGSAYAVNLANGNIFELTLTDNCILTFSNPPASGRAGSVTLILHQDGTGNRTVTWPASMTWASGTAPTLSTAANAIDIIQLFTTDGGTTWRGFLAGLNFS